jgi:queuosine precursor transporter
MERETMDTRAATIVAMLAAAYVAAQILSDVSSLKLANVFDKAIDGGTLIYPITFTLRDLVHKVAGKQVARALIIAAAVINVFMAALFWAVDALPLVPDSGPQSELFGMVLGPVWRIVLASIAAEVISELVDTEVYSAWVRRFGDRSQWGRVLSSNAVAIPVDSVIFAFLAFGGVVSGSIVRQIVLTNIVVKALVTFASIPLIYTVRARPVVEHAA